MKYHVNENCIGCGLCVATCPSVFRMREENVAEAIIDEVLEEFLVEAKEAMENCPVAAIEEVEG